jgi:hypothetical protein
MRELRREGRWLWAAIVKKIIILIIMYTLEKTSFCDLKTFLRAWSFTLFFLRAGRVAQVVRALPCKCEVLSSNHSAAKKNFSCKLVAVD